MGIFGYFNKESESKKDCPLLGKKCTQEKCQWWIKLLGKHPQTGRDIEEWNCSIPWGVLLLTEVSQKTIGTTAAVESFRNVMATGMENMKKVAIAKMETDLLLGKSKKES